LSTVTPCFISPEGDEDLDTAFATVQETKNDDLLTVCMAYKSQIHFCLIKTDLDKNLRKKINDSKITWRFDDFMSSLSNE